MVVITDNILLKKRAEKVDECVVDVFVGDKAGKKVTPSSLNSSKRLSNLY